MTDIRSQMRDQRYYRRLILRRADDQVYLERWGLSHVRIGGILLHKMTAPDPGLDLHDHPWTFVTIPLVGGYLEERAPTREACGLAEIAEHFARDYPHDPARRGVVEERRRFRPKVMRLDECHRIIALRRRTVWTLVINGPRRRTWGFYVPKGWKNYRRYGEEEREARRDLVSEVPR